jgi:hypothetical protein
LYTKLNDLHQWLIATVKQLSKKSDLAGAIHYALARWTALTRYRDDGRIEIDNNANRVDELLPWNLATQFDQQRIAA